MLGTLVFFILCTYICNCTTSVFCGWSGGRDADKHEGLSPSFDEAVIVLYRWFIEGHPLPAIQAEFQWMGDDTDSQ